MSHYDSLVAKAMADHDLSSDSPSKKPKSSFRSRTMPRQNQTKTPRFLAVVEEMQRRRTMTGSCTLLQDSQPQDPPGVNNVQTSLMKEGTLTVGLRPVRRISINSQNSFQSGI
jgi:hypothetical protein